MKISTRLDKKNVKCMFGPYITYVCVTRETLSVKQDVSKWTKCIRTVAIQTLRIQWTSRKAENDSVGNNQRKTKDRESLLRNVRE